MTLHKQSKVKYEAAYLFIKQNQWLLRDGSKDIQNNIKCVDVIGPGWRRGKKITGFKLTFKVI